MLEDDPFDDGASGIVPCPCTAKSFKGNGTPSLGGNCGTRGGFFVKKMRHQKASQSFLTDLVVVSNIFYFHPYFGKIPILANIFQMG